MRAALQPRRDTLGRRHNLFLRVFRGRPRLHNGRLLVIIREQLLVNVQQLVSPLELAELDPHVIKSDHGLSLLVLLGDLSDLLIPRGEMSEDRPPSAHLLPYLDCLADRGMLLVHGVNLQSILEGGLVDQESDLLCVVEDVLADICIPRVEDPAKALRPPGLLVRHNQTAIGLDAVIHLHSDQVLHIQFGLKDILEFFGFQGLGLMVGEQGSDLIVGADWAYVFLGWRRSLKQASLLLGVSGLIIFLIVILLFWIQIIRIHKYHHLGVLESDLLDRIKVVHHYYWCNNVELILWVHDATLGIN